MEEKHKMRITEDMTEGVNNMCNLSQAIADEAKAKGREEGIIIGIKKAIRSFRNLKISKELVIEQLKEEYFLSDEVARTYVLQNWD